LSRIPVWLVSTTIDEGLRRGMPVERALEGLPITIEQFRNPRGWIEWDTLMTFTERMIEYGSTLQDTAEVFAVSWRHPGLGRAARWISYLSSDRAAYELLLRTAMLAYFRVIRTRFQWLPDGRLQIAFQIVEGHRSHPAIWWAIKGLLQGVPELLTLPHAEVEERAIGRNSASFLVTFPEETASRGRLSWLSRWLAPSRVLGDVIAQQERLASTFELLRSTHERLRKQADALRESEARYRGVIENSADVILVVDPDGSIAMASPSARALLDLDADAQMRHVIEYVHEDDVARVAAAFQCSLREKATAPLDLRVVSRRGREHWLEASARRIPSASGGEQVLVVARDITRRVREEEQQRLDAERLDLEVQKRTHQLQRANEELVELQSRLIAIERMGAARELAGSVAHAINNPLSALIGYAQMLLEEAQTPDERIERILQQAKRIRAVVEGTLELSRGEKPDLTPEDPVEVLDEVKSELEVACRERAVSIELRPPSLPALVCADRTLLRTALVALTENAIEASPHGGVVTLEMRIHKKRNVLEFCIEDHGPGIPEDLRARVFEPFFTTKRRGTGLGLAIARAVVARHDGSLALERSEVGTRARVELPLYVAPGTFSRRSSRARRNPPGPTAAGRATP
jgi:PAS domain S-box-containing protein